MACVENIPPVHGDSEREEGEIVDELDDLSDISSEEEFLLRQRLQVLENYNNVLERKKAKKTSVGPGKNDRHKDEQLCDLSEISATELEDPYVVTRDVKQQKHVKTYHKPKRRKDPAPINHLAKRDYRKKTHKYKKKPVISESSDESEDEYRNKRRKLADAVAVKNKINIDKTSLKARLTKMLLGSQNPENDRFIPDTQTHLNLATTNNNDCIEKIPSPEASNIVEKDSTKDKSQNATSVYESVDLCSDSDVKDSDANTISECVPSNNVDEVDSVIKNNVNSERIVEESQVSKDSDEDLELLREHALKTKSSNAKTVNVDNSIKEDKAKLKEGSADKDILGLSEDDDSDTAELRLICLKSALLKKAIEMKQKQKLRKRLSQSSNLNEELMRDQTEYLNEIMSENNTDIESVDMDMGSDADEKSKDSIEPLKVTDSSKDPTESNKQSIIKPNIPKEDEFEEDEDLLRAKLLTSLSKNLPNLVDPNIMKSVDDTKTPEKDTETENQVKNIPQEKRFIINLGNSDSEGEHEATKNLTKMHMKLSEQIDFQQKLDLFLKSTRMEVEKSTLPDVVQQPQTAPSPKSKEKFVPKTVKHLPKSEQMEYKNLVKRMAELEKIKNARQSSINLNKGIAKDTLKPRNVTIDTEKLNSDLDEKIALSRKTIAEESAKVLKLKEDATKLSQKYKIVATELRNIATAITFNKKEQKSAQTRLSKIRAQHQLLLNRLTTSKHSLTNGNFPMTREQQKSITVNAKRPQKENDPKEDFKNPNLLKAVQVSVVNDLKEVNEPNPRLSIQIEVANNKKTVKIPKSPVKDRTRAVQNNVASRTEDEGRNDNVDPLIDSGLGEKYKNTVVSNWGSKLKNDDYKSPLQALGTVNWEEDPNAVLCPFEVGGHCKDPDCKYLHPKILPDQ